MSDGEEIVNERTGGGARAPQARCFRRIHGETAGACQYYPISAAEYQAGQRQESALENCNEKAEGEVTFAEAMSEEVVIESPAPPPSPPVKQTCPAVVKDLEAPLARSQTRSRQFTPRTIAEALVEGATPHLSILNRP